MKQRITIQIQIPARENKNEVAKAQTIAFEGDMSDFDTVQSAINQVVEVIRAKKQEI